MEWLLKIVEGPMKGAEIALPDGITLTFGSGADCDIVVQDASVPERACEISVDETGVKMKVGEDAPLDLQAYEMHAFGTTTLAIGPTEGAWEPLVRECEREPREEEDAVGSRVPTRPPDEASPDSSPSPRPSSSRRLPLVAAAVAVLVLLVAGLCCLRSCSSARREACVAQALSLEDIAAQHGLSLSVSESPAGRPVRVLRGNLSRRTERLAIRALALAADPSVKFDLTDDETLLASASELLFACSDGALTAESASNRVVAISGFAPSAQALTTALRALNADVKGIDRVDASRVQIGGIAPAVVRTTPFARGPSSGEHSGADLPAHAPNLQCAKPGRDYPIAGILTVPYPCVVMRNGVRLVEGAQLGKAVLVKIESDKLTFREGSQTVEWRP